MQPVIEVKNCAANQVIGICCIILTGKLQKGDHWIVFGMNGCGKTTLLSIIAGYNDFTTGSVKIFGEAYNNDNILQNRKKIGWVSSSFLINI